jgi:hypothetical protein
MKTFLDCLTIYDDSVVDAACRNIAREAREFPPSAGEVRAACERIMITAQPHKGSKQGNYGRPLDQMTPEEKEASKARVAEMVRKYKESLPPPDPAFSAKSSNKKDAPVSIGSALFDSMVGMMDK